MNFNSMILKFKASQNNNLFKWKQVDDVNSEKYSI